MVGPGEKCAGVTYLAPFETQLKKVGDSTHVITTLPLNIRQPLPGVEGGLPKLPTSYFKTSIKVKGKKGQKPKTSVLREERRLQGHPQVPLHHGGRGGYADSHGPGRQVRQAAKKKKKK